MKRRSFLISTLLAFVWSAMAVWQPLAAEVTLARKLSNRQKFSTTTKIESQQTLTINGSPIVTKSSQTRVLSSQAGERRADGEIDVQVVTEALQAKIEVPVAGLDINFDSAKPDEAKDSGPLGELLKLAGKMKYTVTYDAQNSPKKVDMSREAFNSLDDATKKLVESQLDPNNVLEAIISEEALIPAEAVKVGDKWEKVVKMRLEGQQIMTFKIQCQYEGPARHAGRDVERVATKATEVTYAMEGDLGGLKFQKADLRIEDQGGAMLFDPHLGQIVHRESDYHIAGKIDFEVGGTALPADLDLRMKVTTDTL